MVQTFTKMIPEMKMSESEDFIYFLNGPCSQWFPSNFHQRLAANEERLLFDCAERHMMAAKAFLFKDYATFEKIMALPPGKNWQDVPRACKELGREVHSLRGPNFKWDDADIAFWKSEQDGVVFRGNNSKFTQDPDLTDFLASTLRPHGAMYLVEGAWYDKVWGVGLAWDNPLILDSNNWKGENRLGDAIMKVRSKMTFEWLDPSYSRKRSII